MPTSLREAQLDDVMADADRLLLCNVLCGEAVEIGQYRIPELARMAKDEGVEGLLSARLPDLLAETFNQRVALESMVLEQITREVLTHLERAGIPALLLKGTALAHWAYAQPHLRSCSDVDVLVSSREEAEQLAHALCHSGYRRARTSGELVAYELMCTRAISSDWAVEVDVHWRLSNSTLFANHFTFSELMTESISIPSLGHTARGLGPVHALLHAGIHRASNLMTGAGDRLKWLYDFVVLAQFLTADDWRRVVSEATRRQLAGPTLAALEAAGAQLGLQVSGAVMQALGNAAESELVDRRRLGDWRYMEAQTLRSLPGWGARMRWAWQRLFPSRDYMRHLYGLDKSYPRLMLDRFIRAYQKVGR